VPPALRPVVAVGFAGSAAASTGWTFVGVWAISHVGAGGGELGFLVAAIAGGAAGYGGGHLSDLVGRRPLVVAGWGAQALVALGYLLVDHRVLAALALVAGGSVCSSIGSAASRAIVADLVPRERHEQAYASVRVAQNLGVTCGPPLGGLLLLGGHWGHLFAGVAVLAAVAAAVASWFLPRTGAYAPEAPPTRGSFDAIRRDRPFLLFFVSGSLAYLVYVAFETVLPIAAVESYGLAPATWGFLVVINPALVTLCQLRLTRRVASIPAGPKLVTAMLLMGLPFLVLGVEHGIAAIVGVIAVLVLGEMLWVPTFQGIAAGLAPADLRGAYMGAFGSTSSFGFALGPFVGLQLRGLAGDTAAWTFFATVAAAATGAASTRFAERAGRRVPLAA